LSEGRARHITISPLQTFNDVVQPQRTLSTPLPQASITIFLETLAP